MLIVFLEELDEVLVDALVLCLELVVGMPLTVTMRARHAVRRTNWGCMAEFCSGT